MSFVPTPVRMTMAVAATLALAGCVGWNPAPQLTYPTPVVRHLDGLYYGCAVGGDSLVGDQVVRGCRQDVALTEADLGPEAFKVGADRGLDISSRLFAEHEAASIGVGSPVFTIAGTDPMQRLAARRSGRLILLTRHPVSNAKTLAEVLANQHDLGELAPIESNDYVRLEIYGDAGETATVGDRAKLDAALGSALASPVDWKLQPTGRRFRLLAFTAGSQHSTVYYHPDSHVIVASLYTSGLGGADVPVKAPDSLRAMLDEILQIAK